MRNKKSESKARNTCVFTFSFLISHFSLLVLFNSCSLQHQLSRSAKTVINDSSLQTAHIGISIYEPGSGKYWYNYQGDKYFVPASNTKIPTCYAAMKYLGDSLVGLRYGIPEEKGYRNTIVIAPTADPTFLHNDYKRQPVLDFIKQKVSLEKWNPAILIDYSWQEEPWGGGWSWNDHEDAYMAERSPFPVFGNTIDIILNDVKDRITVDSTTWSLKAHPFKTGVAYFDSVVNRGMSKYNASIFKDSIQRLILKRGMENNNFDIKQGRVPFTHQAFPFVTNGSSTTIGVLQKEFNIEFAYVSPTGNAKNVYSYDCSSCDIGRIHINKWETIHSQPTDSLLKPMMHRSDNFFAEQSLLMVSNERLGVMSDEQIIDTLLKTDFKDLPQKPRWVDGCGLSRYNLFTPQDFVFILKKIKDEFGMDRIKNILATGGEGTISNYYLDDKGYIYAKTGSLSGVLCLSGYLYTKKNKLLIFSVLVNNYRATASGVRRAVEKFLQGIRNNY